MTARQKSRIPEVLNNFEAEILAEWSAGQVQQLERGSGIRESELRDQCARFLRSFRESLGDERDMNIHASQWQPVRELLTEVSQSRGRLGFSPSETARFVFSFKQPLFSRLRRELPANGDLFTEEFWQANQLIDNLGLYTLEVYQKGREAVILRQQQEMLELSTPVVKLWEDILALPLIGTLDSARTQVVMESLLQKIVETGAEVAIIDITGVPTVDTLVAQHLIKTVTAARLMGAECMISGIRPQIAQTIVHLGIQLTDITTKATLADAFALALKRKGFTTSRHPAAKE